MEKVYIIIDTNKIQILKDGKIFVKHDSVNNFAQFIINNISSNYEVYIDALGLCECVKSDLDAHNYPYTNLVYTSTMHNLNVSKENCNLVKQFMTDNNLNEASVIEALKWYFKK